MIAHDALDQGTLASAILTEQRMHTARMHAHGHLIECHKAKAFRHGDHFERQRHNAMLPLGLRTHSSAAWPPVSRSRVLVRCLQRSYQSCQQCC